MRGQMHVQSRTHSAFCRAAQADEVGGVLRELLPKHELQEMAKAAVFVVQPATSGVVIADYRAGVGCLLCSPYCCVPQDSELIF